jgi:hypothetical protein
MRRYAAGVAAAILVVSPLFALAETPQPTVQDVIVVGPDTQLGADAGKQSVNGQSKDLRGDWQAFLTERGLHEGQNEPQSPDQGPFQIFMAVGDVKLATTDPRWLDERAVAYEQAMVAAKEKYAAFLDSEVQAGRVSSLFERKGLGIPDFGDEAAKTLSTLDRMRTLADKALDEQIKTLDPTWDGTGRTAAQRDERVVMLRRSYQEQISAHSQALTIGATPIYTAEGPTPNGYGVLVGIVVSGNMRKIARAISDPTIKLPADAPEAPVAKQIADRYREDPTFLTATEGVRIMTDEHGARVLVCFAGVSDSGDSMTTEKEAELTCRGRVAQFVAEQIASDSRNGGGMAFDKLAPVQNSSEPDTRVSFNKQMQSRIKATTPQVSMSGLIQIGLYETQHHWAHQPMTVAIYQWSQASSATAQQLRRENDQEKAPGGSNATASGTGPSGVPAATNVSRGLSTNPSKY